MGATFDLLHIRSHQMEEIENAIVEALTKEGYRRSTADEAHGNLHERRIALTKNGDWISFYDENAETDMERLNSWAVDWSARFKTVVLNMTSYDSDVVWLAGFDNGKKLGSLECPKDAKRSPDGRKRLNVDWLVDYAKDKKAHETIAAGVRADYDLAEQTLQDIGKLLGIDEPCSYPDRDDDFNLYFLPEHPPVVEDSGPAQLSIAGYAVECHSFAGESFHWHFTIRQSGRAVSPIMEIIVSGSGFKLIDLQSTSQIRLDENKRLEFHAKQKSIDDTQAVFEIENSSMPEMPPISETMFHGNMSSRKFAAMFVGAGIVLNGVGRHAGIGALCLTIRYANQPTSATSIKLPLRIEPKLYSPLLPEGVTIEDGSEYMKEEYTNPKLIIGWCAWSGKWKELENFVLGSANALARCLLQATHSDVLKVSLKSAGRTVSGRNKYGADDDFLAEPWEKRRDILQTEGKLQITYEAGSGPDAWSCEITVLNQPKGDTQSFPEDREKYRTIGQCFPRPVTLAWSLPFDFVHSESQAQTMDKILTEASNMPDCIGGFVANARYSTERSGIPYESLSGIGISSINPGDLSDWLKQYVRTPGWRVIIPHAAAARLKAPPAQVRILDCAAGKLMQVPSIAPSMVTHEQRRASETYLLPSLPGWEAWHAYVTGRNKKGWSKKS